MNNTIEDIAAAVSAHKLINPVHGRTVTELATDSRSVVEPAKTLFAALRTPVGDGHKYISGLYQAGVRSFLVETLPNVMAMPDASFIVVDSVVKALGQLAAARLGSFDGGIIVTGSHGKTTVKELLYRALLPYREVRRSPRSWNSQVGVPLAVWNMTENAMPALMVTEAGIDGPGQGEALGAILGSSHRVAVVTPITDEHDEAFGSHVAKVKEKLKIIQDCSTIIYADTDPCLAAEIAAFVASHPDIKAIPVHAAPASDIFHALVHAAVAAIGLPVDGVDVLPRVDTRREIQSDSFGNTVIRDRFTPDAVSMRQALDFMRRHAGSMENSILIVSGLLHACSDEAKVRELYQAAFDTAGEYGVKSIICTAAECAGMNFRVADGVELTLRPGGEATLLDAYYSGNLCHDSRILIFGTDTGFADAFTSAGHETVLEVDLDAVVHNYNYYRSLLPQGTGLVGMVKASAYGMGAIEIGRTLQSQGAAYLAVAVIEEAIDLRAAGITMPIMVLNPVTNRYAALFAHRVEPAVFSMDELKRLISEARRAGVRQWPVHIKLDTGMHRVGFLDSQLDEMIECLKGQTELKVASVFSHLATADCLDKDAYTHAQLDAFYKMTDRIHAALGYDFRRHILNTAGMMRFSACGPYEMGRLGIGLYGISPLPADNKTPLKPVATFRSRIVSIKHWPEGTSVGYGCCGMTERPSVIATVPVGYADGVNRHLGCGRGSFLIGGVLCPTIGNICMDQCMVDVTDVEGVAVGDSVGIFGSGAPVERLAEVLDTIPYEPLTSVSPRVRRVYFKR